MVEDEYFLADDITRALEEIGASVLGPVGNVREALEFLAAKRPIDFAVLDINLRGELSYPVADRLIESGVPFVLGTGYDVEALPTRYRGVPRWSKPFDPASLARAVMALGCPERL